MAKLTICRRIRCPGLCGGLAELEAEATTAFRPDGTARYFRRAECLGRCPHPDGKPFAVVHEVAAERPPHLPPPSMIPTKETNTMGNTATATKDTNDTESNRERLRAALKASGHNAGTLGNELGYRTAIYSYLKDGTGLGPERLADIMAWVDLVEQGEVEKLPPRVPPWKQAQANRKANAAKANPTKKPAPPAPTAPADPAPVAPTLLDAYRAMLSPMLEEILREGCADRGLCLPQGVRFSVGLVEQP